jgi:hypothetical protein
MKKGLAVFSGSAVVHKLMQDGTVVLGTAANPAAVTVSGSVNVTGQMTASANSVLVGNVGGEFTNTTLGGILVELKNSASSQSGSLKSYIDAQDVAVGNAAAAALGAYTASNNAALAQEVQDRISGDNAQAAALGAYTASNNAALAVEVQARIDGDASVRSDLSAALTASSLAASSSLEGVRSDLQGQIDVLAGGDLSGTLSSIAEIQSFLDGQAGGVEGILTGFNDLSVAVNAISGALSQEVTDRESAVSALALSASNAIVAEEAARIAGDQDLQDQIDALQLSSSGDVTSLRADFNAYTSSNDSALAAEIARATAAEATLTSDLAAEVTRATGAESVLTADLAAEVVRATAAEVALGGRIDGVESDLSDEVARATAAEQGLADDIADEASRAQTAEAGLASDIAAVAADLATETTNRVADVDAEELRATTAEAALGVRIDGVEADLATEQARAEAAEAGLQSAIDTEKGRIDAILSGSSVDLDNFKEVVDFVNSIDLANDNALAGAIIDINATASQMRSDFNAYTASNDAALAAEVSRAQGVEAGLQAQIDASAFQVNGMSVPAKSGSFSIVGSSNINVASAAGVVTVSLKDQVSITGSLSAAQLSASAGLSVVGGASVAGGLTVSSGDMSVSQGAVSVKMTRVQAAARTAQDGDMFYLTDTSDDPSGTFPRGKAWYFRQDGAWFDAPFFQE